jgi:hypothetical protein
MVVKAVGLWVWNKDETLVFCTLPISQLPSFLVLHITVQSSANGFSFFFFALAIPENTKVYDGGGRLVSLRLGGELCPRQFISCVLKNKKNKDGTLVFFFCKSKSSFFLFHD